MEKPDGIKVNSKESLLVARQFEEIVKESGLSPYNKRDNRGFWRILLYRESKVTKQVLVCVVVSKNTEQNPTNIDDIPAETKQKLIDTFKEGTEIGDRGYKVCSLSVITSADLNGGYQEGDQWEVLSGKPHYEEILCGLKFTVSPFAFF